MEDLNITDQENTTSLITEDVISVRDAVIERILPEGYVTISYIIVHPNFMVSKNLVTLVVGSNTLIRDAFGESFSFRDLKIGMIVEADFSPAMTFSIPPQSRAFKIVVSYKNMLLNAKMDRVLKVDIQNRLLYTGNANDIYSQIRFVITTSTSILDRMGNRIRLQDIRHGQLVRIAYAAFMAVSIHPQTTAFEIWALEE